MTPKAGHMALRCDMCGKPLKSRRFQIQVFMRPHKTMTVGPDCYKKEKEAAAEMKSRFTEEQLNARRAKIASQDSARIAQTGGAA